MIRILLADDHRLMRRGLRSLLDSLPGVEVVAEADDGREALRLAVELAPDLILMDVTMPGLNGIDAARMLKTELPRARVVALSMHADARFVAEMLAAGARGHLLKECAFEELEKAIRSVMAGARYLSPGLRPPEVPARNPLSPREREVLQLLAEGRSTREIAERLCVSVKTVEAHRQHVAQKLGLRSLAALVKYAIREGLTEPGG